MRLNGLVDVFLEFCLLLIHIHIVKKLIVSLFSDCHELGLSTMALAKDVLQDLVVSAELFFVLSHDSVHAIDCSVSDELLELCHRDELSNVSVEHHIVSHADITLVILVMLTLTHTIWQAP